MSTAGVRRAFPGYTGPVNPTFPTPEGEASISIFGYRPALSFAVVAVIVFALLLLVHGWYARRKVSRTFHGLLAFGCLLEVAGYVPRALAHKNPFIVNYFVISYFMVVCAPVFMSAVYYVSLRDALRRLPTDVARRIIGFNPRIFVWTFVTIDVVTTIIQIAGAALTGVAQSKQSRGQTSSVSPTTANNLLLAGLVLQLVGFFGFVLVLLWCMFQDNRHKPIQLNNKFTFTLLVTSVLFLLRTTFRLAESIAGLFGFSSEPLFACLEFAPVALAVLIWAILPVEKLLPPQQRVDSFDEKRVSNRRQFETDPVVARC